MGRVLIVLVLLTSILILSGCQEDRGEDEEILKTIDSEDYRTLLFIDQ